MKKFILIFMILVIMISICSCNANIGIGTYEFEHVHVNLGNESKRFTIEKWYDNEGNGVEVAVKELDKHIFLSDGTYIMFEDEDDCFFCN